MGNKKTLKIFFESKRKDEEYIEKFEDNILYFNELLSSGHKEDLEFALNIKIYNYIYPLSYSGNYSKALEVAIATEKELEKIKGQSTLFKLFSEGCRFQKALNLSRLKRYKESNVEFEELLKNNPTNDNFLDWHKSNQANIIWGVFNKIIYVSIGFYICIMIIDFIGYEIDNHILRTIGLIIGLLAYATAFLWTKSILRKK